MFHWTLLSVGISKKMLPMNNFAANLRHYRILLGSTQKQMAERLGMTENAYQNYEYDKRESKLDVLIQIAEILEVSIDDLLLKNLS